MNKLVFWAIIGGMLFLPTECFSWTADSCHLKLTSLTVELVASELGGDFDRAREFLGREDVKKKLFEGSIAPDIKPELEIPPTLHCWEAKEHCGFLGPRSRGSLDVVRDLKEKARESWENGDEAGACYYLGCMLHLVQDAAFCYHSNGEVFGPWDLPAHSEIEHWVDEQIRGKDSVTLYREAWAIRHGGLYLKQGWADEQGQVHWPGGLEGWVDVAAHLGYDRLPSVRGLDYESLDLHASAYYMFVQAQRAGAGLLLDFLQEVGLVDKPLLCYPRREGGGVVVYSYRLGEEQAERLTFVSEDEFSWQMEYQGKLLWPQELPDGRHHVYLGTAGDGSVLYRRFREGQTYWHTTQNHLDRAFPYESEMIRHASHVWYPCSYLVALADRDEGLDCRHIVLLPAIPTPDRSYHYPSGRFLPFSSPDEYTHHEFQRVLLPE